MSDTKRDAGLRLPLVDDICSVAIELDAVDAAALLDRLLARIAEADDVVIEAMAKIRCCGIEGCCYQDHRRSELCGAMNAYGGEARAALAAAMRQIVNGGK